MIDKTEKDVAMADKERLDIRIKVLRIHLNTIKRCADVCSDFLDRLCASVEEGLEEDKE